MSVPFLTNRLFCAILVMTAWTSAASEVFFFTGTAAKIRIRERVELKNYDDYRRSFSCGGGQQTQAGTQEFLYQENEKQNYLLLLCNQRTLLHINQKQYYMQPFTFLLMPFGGKPLSLETQGITFYRYLHFQCDEILINELLRHGFFPAEPYPMARPLDIECIWRMLFPVAQTGNISQELEESAMKLLLCLLMMPSDGAATRAAEIPHYDRLTSLPVQDLSISGTELVYSGYL